MPRPTAGGRRHAVFERAHELFVVGMGIGLGAFLLPFALADEALALVDRVVDVGAAADDLHPGDDAVEGLADLGVVGMDLDQRPDVDRQDGDEGGLDQLRLDDLALQGVDQAGPVVVLAGVVAGQLGQLVAARLRRCRRRSR